MEINENVVFVRSSDELYSQQDVSDLYGYWPHSSSSGGGGHSVGGDVSDSSSRFSAPGASKVPAYERSGFFSPPGANSLQSHFNGFDKTRHGNTGSSGSSSKYQVSNMSQDTSRQHWQQRWRQQVSG